MTPKEKVYKAFYDNLLGELYFSQLKSLTSLSNSSLQNILEIMKKGKLLEEKKTKAHKFYNLIDKQKIIIEFTKFDIERLKSLDFNIYIPLKNFLKQISNQISFIILFGSASRGKEKKGSDIDLLIVMNDFVNKKLQQLYEQEIITFFEDLKKDLDSTSIYPFSVAFTTTKQYKQNNDDLIVQAKLTGFPIFNHYWYYEVLFDENISIISKQRETRRTIQKISL